MKKSISLVLILVLVVSSVSMSFSEDKSLIEKIGGSLSSVVNSLDEVIRYTVSKFSDIKTGAWYTNIVSKLVGMGAINGYNDGTFRPNGTITRAEFTALLLGSLGHKEEGANGEHWAMNYIRKAESLRILDKGEFAENTLNQKITRGEMAKMIARSIESNGETYPSNMDEYKGQINDFNGISSSYRDFVLKVYVKGIISGYPDGTFKAERNLTRAEAATVVVKTIDASERTVPQLVSMDDIEETRPGGFKMIKAEIARDYEMQVHNSFEFTDDGLKGYLPELPEGYEWDLRFGVHHDPKDKINNLNMTILHYIYEDKLIEGQDFFIPVDWSKVTEGSFSVAVARTGGSFRRNSLTYYPSMELKELVNY